MTVLFRKKIACFLIILIIISIVSPIVAKEDFRAYQSIEKTMTVTLSASSYDIIQTSENASVIKMTDFGSLLQPGYPKLPSKIFFIGIPKSSEIISVDLIDLSSTNLPGTFNIEKTKPLYQLGSTVKSSNQYMPPVINDPYPSSVFTVIGSGAYHDQHYLRIRFNPFSYHPIDQTLTLHHHLTLEITYTIPVSSPSFYPLHQEKEEYVYHLIENYEQIRSSTLQDDASLGETYDYVIITAEYLEDSVLFLKYWRELRGLKTKIVNISWIFDHYTGKDGQEQIHNFLKDKYLEWGIQYVLIVGSDSLIPMKDCYPDTNNHGFGGVTPTDYYYADLTGDWDADGDGYYGEKGDDEPDFSAEVFVGRIPFDDSSTVEQICDKIINFEQTDDPWKKQGLLIGAFLTLKNEDHSNYDTTDGAYLMQLLKSTVLSPNSFSSTTLYEKSGLTPSSFPCDYPLTQDNVVNQFSQGYGFVNWNGHGLYTATYRLYWSYDDGDGVPESRETSSPAFISTINAGMLDNEKPAIVFSCSCENAHPEYKNLGSTLLEQGAVAFIGATRNAWGTVGWKNIDDGGCSTLDYLFSDYLINHDEPVGAALYKAKLDYNNYYDWWGWETYQNMYDFNIYGDPATSYDAITSFSPPETPTILQRDSQGVILTNITFSAIGGDVDDHHLFYQWDFDDGPYSSWVGPYIQGEETLVLHQWLKPGYYNVSVRVKDVTGMMSDWSDPFMIKISSPVIEIKDIKSGIGSFRIELTNTGGAEAAHVNWQITLEEGLFLNTKSSGTISLLEAGNTAIIRHPFIFGFGLPAITITIQSQKIKQFSESTTALILGPLIII